MATRIGLPKPLTVEEENRDKSEANCTQSSTASASSSSAAAPASASEQNCTSVLSEGLGSPLGKGWLGQIFATSSIS